MKASDVSMWLSDSQKQSSLTLSCMRWLVAVFHSHKDFCKPYVCSWCMALSPVHSRTFRILSLITRCHYVIDVNGVSCATVHHITNHYSFALSERSVIPRCPAMSDIMNTAQRHMSLNIVTQEDKIHCSYARQHTAETLAKAGGQACIFAGLGNPHCSRVTATALWVGRTVTCSAFATVQAGWLACTCLPVGDAIQTVSAHWPAMVQKHVICHWLIHMRRIANAGILETLIITYVWVARAWMPSCPYQQQLEMTSYESLLYLNREKRISLDLTMRLPIRSSHCTTLLLVQQNGVIFYKHKICASMEHQSRHQLQPYLEVSLDAMIKAWPGLIGCSWWHTLQSCEVSIPTM